MRHERILGHLILSEFVLGLLGVIGEFALEPFLPGSLRAVVAADGGRFGRLSDTLQMTFWVVVVAGTVVSWIGLLNLVRPARPLYVCAWVAYLALIVVRGPVVSTSVGYAVQMLMALVGGAMIGLVYFSALRTKFRTLAEVVARTTESTA